MSLITNDLNYYEILGIDNYASIDDINKAYRKKALECHPDRGGTTESMQLINEAYEYLLSKKQEYDEWLKGVLEPDWILKEYSWVVPADLRSHRG